MCIFTNGYKDDLRVSNTTELYRAALELFNNYNPANILSDAAIRQHFHEWTPVRTDYRQDATLPMLANRLSKALPRMLLTDTQINSVAKAYIHDDNFGSFGSELNMWKFYNLLTGANKSSYIDSFLDRSLMLLKWQLESMRLYMGMSVTNGSLIKMGFIDWERKGQLLLVVLSISTNLLNIKLWINLKLKMLSIISDKRNYATVRTICNTSNACKT